ncbi:hypothetical protein HDU97_009291 [Phlyctochytrium planicorne]|nr:hypothetical protein HDU97_009291 [Phlyctochytrium planicorne]
MIASVPFLAAAALAFTSISLAAPAPSQFQYSYGSSDVSLLATGEQFQCVIFESHGGCIGDSNITVSLAVANKAFVKEVGVRYTNNSWTDIYEAFGTYERKLDNNFELWNIVIPRGRVGSYSERPEYILAAFTSYNKGPRAWDPSNNYYTKTTPSSPVRILSDTLDYDGKLKKVVLKGSARTYSTNKAADYVSGKLVVRWTLNDGNTTTETPCIPPTEFKDSVWTFSVPLSDNAVDAATVKYELRFKNDRSGSGSKYLKPSVYFQGFRGGNVLTGFQGLNIFVFTDIPVSTTVTYDNGPKVDVPGQDYRLDTTKLSNGKHNVTVASAFANGGSVFYTNSYEVTVDNRVDLKGQSTAVVPAGFYSSTEGAVVYKEKVYVAVDGIVVKFDNINSQAPSKVYKGPTQSYSKLLSVAADDNSVYALDLFALYKFVESTGAIDTKFASNGTLKFDRDSIYDGQPLCYSHAIVVVDDALLVQDSCNARVLKFSAATGAFINSLTSKGRSTAFGLDGKDVIIVGMNPDSFTVAKIDPTTNTYIANSTITYPGSDEVEGIAKADNAYAVLRFGQRLEYYSTSDNTLLATWDGGSASNLPGQFSNAYPILPLSDGTLAVVDYYTQTVGNETRIKFQKFGQKLLA